mgnify:CR=1 FL=1
MRGRVVGGERLTLQYVKADAAELVDVWVVDLGEEADLWGGHWVVIWEEEFEVEDATWAWVSTVQARQTAAGGRNVPS